MLSQELLEDISKMMKSTTYKNVAKKHKVANWEMQRAIAFVLGVSYVRKENFDNKYQKTLEFYKRILELNILTTTKQERDTAIQDYPDLKLNHDNLQAFNSFRLGYEYELIKERQNDRTKRAS